MGVGPTDFPVVSNTQGTSLKEIKNHKNWNLVMMITVIVSICSVHIGNQFLEPVQVDGIKRKYSVVEG